MSLTPKSLSSVLTACGAAVAVGAVIGSVWLVPHPASATPAYASQTGKACGSCHVSKSGGGALTSFGKAFAANGHKVPGKGGAKGKSSGAAPGGTATVEAVPVASGRSYLPDTTGSPRQADYVHGTNPGVVFYGPSPGPVMYGGGMWR